MFTNNVSGVHVTSVDAKNNQILFNVFTNITNLNIDLGNDGQTANDLLDIDVGPNNLQNFPVIESAFFSDCDLLVVYTVDSDPVHSVYPLRVQFYASNGEKFILEDNYTVQDFETGSKVLNVGNIQDLAAGDFLVSTATDFDGNTSEFSSSIEIITNISLLVTTSDATCEDSSDGSIDITVSGGCNPFIFNWTGPNGFVSTSEDINGLIPGIYSLVFTDEKEFIINSGDIIISSNPSPVTSISGAKTVFFGYGPMSSADLTVSISSGTAPYSILWSTGETTDQITVSPQQSTSFSVTVTDANGCSSAADVFIPVIDVRCGNNLDKVSVCHTPPGNLEIESLCISENSVETHLSNGDFLASCDGIQDEPEGYQPFTVSVYPNPFVDNTNINYSILEEEW